MVELFTLIWYDLNKSNVQNKKEGAFVYTIGIHGSWRTIPKEAAAVYDRKIRKLEAFLRKGLDLNAPIAFKDGTEILPLEIAICRNDPDMILYLIEHGADPNADPYTPLLSTAVRFCDPDVVEIVARHTGKLDKRQKRMLFEDIRYGNRPENIPVLETIGITVAEFGGDAFRSAVSEGNTEWTEFFLKKGVDINYHEPDMVFPYASTPVTEAARSNNFPMVRRLVEQGADITIADQYGDRPYTEAVKNKNQEMADYLKALEPEDWHNEQEKARQLKPYKLPTKLVDHLKNGPLRLEFPEKETIKWAELYPYMDIKELTWKRKKLLSLMLEMDKYGASYQVVWSPKDKKVGYLDIEHGDLHIMGTWEDFIADPGRYLNGIIEGEYLK
ncbi:MAG: ankyrin repeat domain-containing protein [Ruminococcaceae bacterium]|nr:ankyrin repeat domain-containing protein [Oscillospiraceae bacterium]